MRFVFLFSVFVVATCGLIYELVASTAASYLLGDSVTQFSTVIGVYLFAMGVGSYASKYFRTELLKTFITVELLVGLFGGLSSTMLFIGYNFISSFHFFLYLIVFIIGSLVGLEIPLMLRILKDRFSFDDLVAKIFSFDYVGALLASLLFPLVLVPYLGLLKTSYLFGMFNAAIAFFLVDYLKAATKIKAYLRSASITVVVILCVCFAFSERILSWSESLLYQEKIIISKSSKYQRIVVTRNKDDIRLYLNGNLQFSSRDEYRYHESLVFPLLSKYPNSETALILGGGDGLALRELLKNKSIKKITLVDLDDEMLNLFKQNNLLKDLNQNSLLDERLTIINKDAFVWLIDNKTNFDIAIVDFPDPSNYSVGKLYTTAFYKLLYNSLSENGAAVIQSTSPYFAPASFWCIDNTIKSCHFITTPYHSYVPSFGEWGYILSEKKSATTHTLPFETKYYTSNTWKEMTFFPKDMQNESHEINKLNNQVLVHLFEKEWSKYAHIQ
jgi:spermidine synthase